MGIGRAFIAMLERAAFRDTLQRIDAGSEYVKEQYHSEDDILRRAEE